MTRPSRSVLRAGAAGFTLIEIMVALAILGTALFVLLEAHYGAMRLFSDAKDQVEVNNLLERALGVAETEVVAGSTSGNGDFGKRYPGFSYSYRADELGDTNQPGFYSVTVILQRPTDAVQMTLLVYKGST
jgi:prepilin-type N-terminal cleavage/methylation domain-containing protein